MHYLLKSVTVHSPGSEFHGKKCFIHLSDGQIKNISVNPINLAKATEVDLDGQYISEGWVDMRSSFCDPGYEFKEDLLSGANAAQDGGFTSVCILPDTLPVIQSKGQINYILNKSSKLNVNILPYGAITQNLEGKEMAEMFDMQSAGAVGFSNANKPIMHSGVLLRSMLYAKGLNSLLMLHSEDLEISAGGKMNEGEMSTRLGLKGIPAIAEEVMLSRAIDLVRYSEARVHFSHLSTSRSISLVRKAKAEGLKVSCDVAIANLILDDSALSEFDSNYKLNPPLRSRADVEALIEAVIDGTIDAIVSDHKPQNDELKVVEFDAAAYGMIALQTFFPLLNSLTNRIPLEKLLNCITLNPRKLLNMENAGINIGSTTDLTIFHPELKWTFNNQTNFSKSKNSPFLGHTFTGKATAIYCKGIFLKNQ